MELAWLEDFVALAESGNFSRAAEARNITQPAFSRRVRALEEWADTPLFVRSVQGARLTPAGELFQRGAPALIRTLAQLRREVREAGGRENATLHFASTHALSFTFFPQWVRGIEERAPLGPVRLLSDSMRACEELMQQGQAQFLLCHQHALASNRLDSRQFQSVRVSDDVLVPLVASDAEGRPRWHLDDRKGSLPLLAYTAESGLGRIVAAHRFEDRLPNLDTIFSAALAATLLGMAREGRGIAWLPESLAEQDLARGSLVRAGGDFDIGVEIRLFRPAARQGAAAERFWNAAQGDA